MSVGTTAAIIAAGVGAGGSIISSAIGAHAAGKAADQQTQAEQQALDFQKQVYGTQVQNEQPYVDLGATSAGQLMSQLKNGTFGAGSNPNFNAPAPFTAPTAAEAQATPGYQFTFDQGMRGVNSSAAARGGALSGGAIKAAAQYGTGLADSTYNDVYNRSLGTYQTNFQDSLAAYQENLAKQSQEFGQESNAAQLGQQGITSIGNTGTQASTNVGNIMAGIGNAQAAGTVGTANAVNQGIGGATSAVSQGIILRGMANSAPGFSTAIGNGGPPLDTYGNPITQWGGGIVGGDSVGGSNPFGA